MARLTFDVGAADIEQLVIAGWTSRDVAALEQHIEELKAIGVQPPSQVPLYYRVGAELLTQADTIQVLGDDTSGEAEAVLVGTPDRLWVTVGADHTDRKVESYGIAVAKQICPKVIGRTAWRFEEIEPHWDRLVLRSFLQDGGARTLYQEGPLARLRPPRDRPDPRRPALRDGARGPRAGPQAQPRLCGAGAPHRFLSVDELDDGIDHRLVGQQAIVTEAARHDQVGRGQHMRRACRFEDRNLTVVLVVDQEHRYVDRGRDVADVEIVG
jgi:hypothetical protein